MIPSLDIATATDRGKVRLKNEDFLAVRTEAGFAVLADGMGGHNAGEVASRMAVDLVVESIAGRSMQAALLDRGAAESLLTLGIARANNAIFEVACAEPRCRGMGTTIVAALWRGARVSIAHVGDSRAYRWRSGRLEALTRDHTVVQDQLDRGALTARQARYSANRNVLTRAVGTDPELSVDVRSHDVLPHDVYLLCSDGVHDMLSDRDIEHILGPLAGKPHLAADTLVQQASEAGGFDNASVVIVRVLSTVHPAAP